MSAICIWIKSSLPLEALAMSEKAKLGCFFLRFQVYLLAAIDSLGGKPALGVCTDTNYLCMTSFLVNQRSPSQAKCCLPRTPIRCRIIRLHRTVTRGCAKYPATRVPLEHSGTPNLGPLPTLFSKPSCPVQIDIANTKTFFIHWLLWCPNAILRGSSAILRSAKTSHG